MKFAAICASLLLALLVMPSVADEPSRPRTPRNDAVEVPYSGIVTEVTKNSISILWPGEAKAKKFPVSETLASGGFATEPRLIPNRRQPYVVSEIHRYRLADVMVGDQVSIQYAHLGDMWSSPRIVDSF